MQLISGALQRCAQAEIVIWNPDGSVADAGTDAGHLPERTCVPSGPGVTGSPQTIPRQR